MKARKREASSRLDLERYREFVRRKGTSKTNWCFELEVGQNWGSELKGWNQKSLPTSSRSSARESAETSDTNPRLVGKYGMGYSRARECYSVCSESQAEFRVASIAESFGKEFVVLFALASAANRGFKVIDLPKRQIDPLFPEQHKGASPVFQQYGQVLVQPECHGLKLPPFKTWPPRDIGRSRFDDVF